MDTDESVCSEQTEDEEEAEIGRSNNFTVPFYLSVYYHSENLFSENDRSHPHSSLKVP